MVNILRYFAGIRQSFNNRMNMLASGGLGVLKFPSKQNFKSSYKVEMLGVYVIRLINLPLPSAKIRMDFLRRCKIKRARDMDDFLRGNECRAFLGFKGIVDAMRALSSVAERVREGLITLQSRPRTCLVFFSIFERRIV